MKMLGHNFEATSSQTLYMLHFQQTLFRSQQKKKSSPFKGPLTIKLQKIDNQNTSLIG